MRFYLYKGLKKPLVLFGLKDKYIYYAMGLFVTGVILGFMLSSLIGFLGSVLGVIMGGIGIWFTFKIQDKKGLYNKTKNNEELYIFPKRFNYKKLKSRRQQ